MEKIKTFFVLLFFGLNLFAVGCATIDSPDRQPPDLSEVEERSDTMKEPPLDRDALESRLKMSRHREQLGIEIKRFNACDLGLSYRNCQPQYFTIIHFQIFCRDSNGTVESVSHSELTPMVARNLSWKLATDQGQTETDHQGYGRIRAVTPISPKSQRFILIRGKHSLGVTASEISKVIIPKDWCD